MLLNAELLDERGWQSLTSRELDVVDLVAMDFTYGEIGDRLCISRRTVETHVERVFNKLSLRCRRELARQARARGLGTTADDFRDRGRRYFPESGAIP